ncbi:MULTISPECIES: type I DNA topoisomerase [Protofrankia]|uniref:DNA topoisomerase 1 n=1 Tax=Candidatus Protofrankia datiscae TaxID=2716812 RepID=F8AYM2_9ACTN|nr:MULTISPECIES: type I DNA topoisomerase [Protofrankia]AEH11593.1 DNA topoisomerase I [Candidatus Protofrankia datiscae]
MPPRTKSTNSGTRRSSAGSSTPVVEPTAGDVAAGPDTDAVTAGNGAVSRGRTTRTARAATRGSRTGTSSPAASGTGVRLVIVESPAKAKTIAGYLGSGWRVESSIGHIRDLPQSAADVPDAHKGKPWARLGVDVDNGFKPLYVVTPDKKSQVSKLKALAKEASELYLATDEDREGEAIAWHLLQTLKPTVPVRRMVFHEITEQAIRRAVDNTREIDEHLVDAQETRRILDRLYGYEVSPVLWKKVMPKLSAGRVQSVATRILVERERARMRFTSAEYWNIEGVFGLLPGRDADRAGGASGDGQVDATPLPANLVALDGRRLATGRDFDSSGQLTSADVVRLDEDAAHALAGRLADSAFAVRSVETKPYRRSPYAPFMTSTLQQEASRKLHFSSQRTMQVAQKLYENGYITYMRTDSTNLSETALAAAREQARALYGAEYVPDRPRIYTKKVKNAQEAHEAIRPAGEQFRTPGEVRETLADADGYRLYELIWRRTVASQMADARGTSATIRIGGVSSAGEDTEFSASGKVITFPGFLRAYVEGADDPDAELDDRERRLPDVREGDALTTRELNPRGHTTNPPPRFTEASLVKTLEELGIGRPSTYASIIGTIQARGYVWKKGSALIPSFVAFAVVGLLEEHFGRLVDYRFTASMEDDLDDIAAGTAASIDWLTRFYFGSDAGQEGGVARAGGLKHLVNERLGEIDAREVNSIPLGVAPDDQPVVIRVGRYGPYVQHGDERASVPEDLPPDELTVDRALALVGAPSEERSLGTDPDSGATITLKVGRFGPYVSTDDDPPRRASLLGTMTPETLTLADALKLLTLPRSLGVAEDGEEVTAQNGRYGPYVKKGSESRSLESEERLFTVTLDEALALIAQPKTRGRRRAAETPPLRELGPDPATGAPMVLREGRFGPYVTDGATNASLRKGDDVASLTVERAAEMLAEKRARGPATPRRRAAQPAKQPAATKTTRQSTAKKTTARKTSAQPATATGTGTGTTTGTDGGGTPGTSSPRPRRTG